MRAASNMTNATTRKRWVWRGAALLLVGLFWSVYAYATARSNPAGVDDQAAQILATPEPHWQAESLYLTSAERLKDPFARLHSFSTAREHEKSTPATEPFRVLAVGDSYTYGFGLTDRGAAWPGQLELELRRRGLDVEVLNVSQPGASFFTYRDWLTGGCEGAGVCADLTGGDAPVDLVIVGFYANDFYPSPGDRILEEQAAATAPPERGEPSPYETQAAAAAHDIVDAAGVPVYWMPLAGIGSNANSDNLDVNWAPDRWWDLVGVPGLQRIPVERSLQAVAVTGVEDLMVNPVDYHPSSILHRAYALDAADIVESEARRANAGPAVNSAEGLVYDSLPAVGLAEVDGDRTLQVTYQPNPDWLCRDADPNVVRARLYWADLPVENLQCDQSGNARVALDTRELRLPYQPCALLGRPYVELFLHPYTDDDTTILIQGQGLLVRSVSYDPAGKRAISEPKPLRRGATFPAATTRSLLIHGDGPGGCGDQREPLGSFTVTITRNS